MIFCNLNPLGLSRRDSPEGSSGKTEPKHKLKQANRRFAYAGGSRIPWVRDNSYKNKYKKKILFNLTFSILQSKFL